MMRGLAAMIVTALLVLPAYAQVDEPAGYRMDHYRAPVPDTLTGAGVISTQDAWQQWQRGGVAFIDVFPRPPKPGNLPKGAIFRQQPRLSLPSAAWLPNVGYGALHASVHAYFRDALAAITDGDEHMPLVFFCEMDCWMSWNAAKRALEMGYTQVFWYPDGTDGWSFEDYPLEEIEPYVLR